MPLLSVIDLHTRYASREGVTHAVNGVTFDIAAGETVGLVGESGCGKSTLGKTLLQLVPASSGRVLLDGIDLGALKPGPLRALRPRVQMIFQDAYASLNQRRSVRDTLETVLRVHGVADAGERQRQVAVMIDRVGLPQSSLSRYPHEFSGGQRQRIGIARALLLRPDLVVCDEPVSALDVSIQAQILNLLVELKREFGLAYLFISHDLAVVRYLADRVMVMQAGRIVENASQEQLWSHPAHPYTRQLIAAEAGAGIRRAH
ncbi:ATP-binding cassette domain-containing protein [Cupriavidus sp. YAF13]|uniref:ATP-binding cassette domain-containing protein n=1 Tax=Cupriavidus sp. YAF13 TaxID=3233075 RepID=UPI003F93AFD6